MPADPRATSAANPRCPHCGHYTTVELDEVRAVIGWALCLIREPAPDERGIYAHFYWQAFDLLGRLHRRPDLVASMQRPTPPGRFTHG